MACEAILASQEDKNPYEISHHAEDCNEEVWEDRDNNQLIDAEEMSERECAACVWEWNLWDRIIEDCGDAEWGEIAFQMLELDDYIELCGMPENITAIEFEYLRAVRNEKRRREAFNSWLVNQKSKDASTR